MLEPPLVSVIIPTRNRADLLPRAVASVLAQSMGALELLVVVDGPDAATLAWLAGVADARLRVLALKAPGGAARARNEGAAAARGAWIALLDDDDCWAPGKLQRQLALAAGRRDVVVSCRSRIISGNRCEIWPLRCFANDMPFGRYLFDRRRWFAGDTYVQSSSLMLPRDLFLRAPFPAGSPHDDWEFVLRLCGEQGAALLTAPEALVDVHLGQARPTLSGGTPWRDSLAWAWRMRTLLTAPGFSGFVLCVVAPRAAEAGDYAALPGLLWQALRAGRPGLMQLVVFFALSAVPPRLRRLLRRARRGAAGGAWVAPGEQALLQLP